MNARQAKFVQEYLIDLNATQAALRAGYSQKTAYSIGQENLKKPEIAAAVQKAQEKAQIRFETTHDEVLMDIASICKEAWQAGKFSPALRAKELIGQHFGMWPAKLEHTGPNGGPLQMITGSVVVDIKDLGERARNQLRGILLAAKAKEQ